MKKIFLIIGLFGLVLNSYSQKFERSVLSAKDEIYIRDTLGIDWVEAHTSGTSVSAGSGLTKTGSTIDLGGTATQHVTVNGASYNLDLGNSGSRFDDIDIYGANITLNTSDAALGITLTAGPVSYRLSNGYFISNMSDTLGTRDDILSQIIQQAPALALNWNYNYSATTTDARPGIGYMRLNNASPASVTQIYIDDYDISSVDKSIFIQLADTGSYFYMAQAGDFSKAYTYEITGIIDASGYTKYIVSYINSIGTISAGSVKLGLINRSGSSTFDTFEYIDLDTSNGTAPPYQAGRIYWDSAAYAASYHTGISNTSNQIGQELWTLVQNQTGSTINNGEAVYIYNAGGEIARVALADADNGATAYKFIGVATNDILNGELGFATIFGDVHDVNTLGMTEGNPIYLSATAGQWSQTKPSAHIVRIGYVKYAHATEGVITINPSYETALNFAVLNNAGNDGTYLDSNYVQTDTLKTDYIQFGDGISDTFIDSTSVTTEEIESTGDTLFIKNIKLFNRNNGYYSDNPVILDRRNPNTYQEFSIGKSNGLGNNYHRITFNPSSIQILSQASPTYPNSAAELGIYGSGMIGTGTSLNYSSVFALDSMNFRLTLDGGKFTVYNSDASDSLISVRSDSANIFIPTNIKSTLEVQDGFSIGGGDVWETSDTIDLKTAIETENFDSINVDTVRAGILYTVTPHSAIYRNTDLTIVATQNIWYKITGFTTKDNDLLTVQGDSVQLSVKGHYFITYTSSFSGNNGEIWELGVFKNAVLEEPSQLRYTSTSDVGNISIPVYVYSDGDDWVSFKIRNTTDSDDPTIKRFSAVISTMHLEE